MFIYQQKYFQPFCFTNNLKGCMTAIPSITQKSYISVSTDTQFAAVDGNIHVV